MKAEVAQEAYKATPPVVITGWAWLNGLPIEKWVGWATLVYIGLQAAYLVWKWYRESQKKE